MVRYQDWTGERKQKCKRGFATKREAQEWERSFQMQTSGDLDMTFEAFNGHKNNCPLQGLGFCTQFKNAFAFLSNIVTDNGSC